MNRFFRSALFPLIVIVLLVYLASQTLMKGEKQEKVTYSQLQQQVESGQPDRSIVANPNKQQLTVEYEPQGGEEGEDQGRLPEPGVAPRVREGDEGRGRQLRLQGRRRVALVVP